MIYIPTAPSPPLNSLLRENLKPGFSESDFFLK